jgi:hypothetical protein
MEAQMPVKLKGVKPPKRKSMVTPDVDDRRFCRHCKKLLPITSFPKGVRRYVCSRHLYELVKLPAKLRVEADDKRCVIHKLWVRCRTDSKAFGQTRIKLTQSEIADILQADGKAIDLAFAIVPTDASRVLSRKNAVVVVNEARLNLLSAHRTGGERMYLSTLEAWRAGASSQEQRAEDLDNSRIEDDRGAVDYVLN